MKRVGHLWEKFCCMENAVKAIELGTQNKRMDRVVRKNLGYTDNAPSLINKLNPSKVNAYAAKLLSELEAGKWHHAQGARRKITSGGKEREIQIARLKDHIVQWMAVLAMQEYWLKRMYRFSCGNIPRRGIKGIRVNVQKWARSGDSKYFVKLDIRQFYKTVKLDKLSAQLHSQIKDKRFLAVLDEIVYSSKVTVDGVNTNIAIGYYSSPWFANLALDPLDKYVTTQLYKERRGKRVKWVKHYARYVDDLLLMGSSKSDLRKAVKAIISFCKDTLGLEIKDCWEICQIGELLPPDAKGKMKCKPGTKRIDIAGYTFTTTTTTVRDRSFLRIRRLAVRIAKRLNSAGVIFLANATALESRIGWFSHADSKYFFNNHIYPIIDIKLIKEVISYASTHGISGNAARIYCGKRGNDGRCKILYGHS